MNEQLKEFDLTKSQLDILRFLKYVKKDHVNQKDIEEFFIFLIPLSPVY